MLGLSSANFSDFYSNFDAPITALDCGKKCAPYNEYGVPFCCDIDHAIPTAYLPEWDYLELNTDLWHLWEDDDLDQFGGAINCRDASALTISHCTIENSKGYGGGGIYLYRSNIEIEDLLIDNCISDREGGGNGILFL